MRERICGSGARRVRSVVRSISVVSVVVSVVGSAVRSVVGRVVSRVRFCSTAIVSALGGGIGARVVSGSGTASVSSVFRVVICTVSRSMQL